MQRIYFDNAATTAIDPTVITEMMNVMQLHYGNPSSIHAEGRKVRALLEDARKRVAKQIGASIGEIFFTSGGTEANNMALKCAVRDLGVERIITSPMEHHCVSHTIEAIEKNNHNIQVDLVNVDEKGHINYEQLEELLQNTTKKTIVSLMHANNEIGTLLDMEKVAELCQKYDALFHSDTVQTIGHLPINVNQTKIHFLSCGAHKFHGPKGVGFIYINGDAAIKPFIDGGSQERNMRGGTENIYGIVGLAKALELASDEMEERKNHILSLKNHLAQRLSEEFEDIQFNGDWDKNSLYTVLSVSFPNSPKADLLLMLLDMDGVSASGGSACSSGAEAGSHVIQAINGAMDRKTIRFSFSHFNTKEEIESLIDKLKKHIVLKKKVVLG